MELKRWKAYYWGFHKLPAEASSVERGTRKLSNGKTPHLNELRSTTRGEYRPRTRSTLRGLWVYGSITSCYTRFLGGCITWQGLTYRRPDVFRGLNVVQPFEFALYPTKSLSHSSFLTLFAITMKRQMRQTNAPMSTAKARCSLCA